MTSVAYVYSASRDASVLNEVLAGFKGILVSDFYGGYDAMPCRQQKCLIHLMRDINEDILKHPFNEELSFVAKRFGALLREIVQKEQMEVQMWPVKTLQFRKPTKLSKR
jgi:transposase